MDLTDLIAKIPASFNENPERIPFTDGNAVVLRRTVPSIIARALAAENQAVLRMGVPAEQYWSIEQLEQREEIELWRILAYTISWTYKDVDNKPIPLVRGSFDFHVPGEHVAELIQHLNARKTVRTPDEDRTFRPGDQRLEPGAANGNGHAPAITADVLARKPVV